MFKSVLRQALGGFRFQHYFISPEGGEKKEKRGRPFESLYFILLFPRGKIEKEGEEFVGNGGRMMMYRARVRSMQRAENALLAAIHCNSVTSGSPV